MARLNTLNRLKVLNGRGAARVAHAFTCLPTHSDLLHVAWHGDALLPRRSGGQKRFRSQALKVYTVNTVRNLDQLLADLRGIRKRGYAVDDEEIEIGLRCVGAPIPDYTGAMVGAISVAAPSARSAEKKIPVFGRLVMTIAEEISEKLGYEKRKKQKCNEKECRLWKA